MAKGAYIGKNQTIPIYTESITALNTRALLEQYFTFEGVNSESTSFSLNDNTGIFTSNNKNIPDSNAQMTLLPKQNLTDLYFDWKVSSESEYDTFAAGMFDMNTFDFPIWVGTSGEDSGTCGPITCHPDCNIMFSYKKDDSTNAGNDNSIVYNIRFQTKTQTGTTTESRATPIHSIYVGVENVARPIIKAYVGVGGKARPFWGFEDLAYYGKFDISNFGQAATAASLKDKAFFGQGSNIMTYDTALTQTVHENILASSLHTGGFSHWPASGAASATTTSEMVFNNDLIAFADGLAMTTINRDLTSIAWPWHGPYPTSTSTSGTYSSLGGGGTASSTSYAFVGGGVTGSVVQGHRATYDITPYSTSGTKQSKLYTAVLGWPGTISNFNGCAIFSSGAYSQGNGYYGKTTTTDIFDDNLTQSTLPSLSTYRTQPQCENLNNTYAVIAGGGTTENGNGSQHSDAEVYNTYGTKQVLDLGVHPDVICKTPLTGDDSKLLLREAKWNAGSTTTEYDTRIYTLDMNLTLECIHSGLLSSNGQRIQDGVGSYVGRYAIIAGGSYYNSANDGDGHYENSYPYMHAYKTI